DVDPAVGADSKAVADVVAGAAAAAGPEHVALGGILQEVELVIEAGTGEREGAEGGGTGEVAGDVDVALGVDDDVVALVGNRAAATVRPQPVLGAGRQRHEEHHERGEVD